jgi:hypothetical protein
MKRIKKPLSLARETIRPLARVVLSGAAGAAQDTSGCSTAQRCNQSTGTGCYTRLTDCCLATQQNPTLCYF